MGGGGSAPTAPDYVAAAKEQGAQNIALNDAQTAANRPNISTPWGTQTWSQKSTGGFDQSAFDKAMAEWSAQPEAVSAPGRWKTVDLGGDSTENVWEPGVSTGGRGAAPTRDQFTTPGSTAWEQKITLTPEQQSALDAQQRIQAGQSGAAENLLGQATSQFDKPMDWSALPQAGAAVSGPKLQTSVAAPNMQMAVDRGGEIGRVGDTPDLVTGVGRTNIQGSLSQSAGDWRQTAQDAVSRLQAPDLKMRRDALTTQLSNQGLTPGSEAWTNAMRQQGDDETRANLAAIAAGRDESAQLFGQDLQSGQFSNNAAGQEFAQGLTAGQFTNSALGQDFQQDLAAVNQGNSAQAQEFGQGVQAGEFANNAQAKQLAGNIAAGGFGNEAQLQELNAAIQSGQYSNDLRKLGISEEQLRRGMTLNELNALLSGQQVQTPNFASVPQAGRAQGSDIMSALDNQYQGQIDAYNVNQANRSSNIAGLTNAGLMASLFAFSDRRLKRDITPLGFTLPNGIKLYKYRFVGKDNFEIGVIAQEVQEIMPNAVVTDGHGYLMVDYNQVLQ